VGSSGGLSQGEVHVWHGQIPAAPAPGETAAPAGDELAILSDVERARLAAIRRPAARVQFVVVHIAVRRVLANYLATDPAAIQLTRALCCRCGSTTHGRPRVAWPATALSHNASHSGRQWLLALAHGRPVGVDVQAHRSLCLPRMSAVILAESELSYLASLPPQAQLPMFFRCWARKEAVLKACGVGVLAKLAAVDVRPAERSPVIVRHACAAGPGNWLVHDLPSGPDQSAAVAQPAAHAGPVRVRAFPGRIVANASRQAN
jgi:4'-phosphopantetheinyl transferase